MKAQTTIIFQNSLPTKIFIHLGSLQNLKKYIIPYLNKILYHTSQTTRKGGSSTNKQGHRPEVGFMASFLFRGNQLDKHHGTGTQNVYIRTSIGTRKTSFKQELGQDTGTSYHAGV